MNKNNDVSSLNKGKPLIKSNTLKLQGSPSNKNGSVVETQDLNLNSEKKLVHIKKKSNLKKANNKIINFITDCMEKIKDEKNNEGHITQHLEEIIEKKRFLKERKRTVKKEVHINLNNIERVSSKKSMKPKKKYMSSRIQIHIKKNANNSNFDNISNNEMQKIKTFRKIEKKGTKTKTLNRISTSKLAKEKEKEIVYNISSSLIALYKPKTKKEKSHFANNTNISNKTNKTNKNNTSNETNKSNNLNNLNNKFKETERFKYASVSNNETNIFKNSKIKNLKKRSSNEENFISSLLNDSPKLKRPSKLKRFETFIKPNNRNRRKSKHKRNSTPNNKNDSFLHLGNDSSISTKKNMSNYHSNILDETDGKRRKSNIQKFKDWTNDLKNREVLTKREYEHIEKDLIQSLIGYEKTKLEAEMKKIESTETTDLVKRLPTMKNRKFTRQSLSKQKLEEGTLININLEDLNLNDKIDKEKFRILQHTGYVYDSLDDEEFEDAIDINNYYISPDSVFIYIFDSIIAISSLYVIFYLPIYLAHDSFIFSSYLNFKLLSFYIIEILFIIDLLISFFRAYYNYDEVLVNNVYDMSLHFINNWFFPDLISSIPFYSIFMFLERNENYKDYSNQINLFSQHGVTINKLQYL